MTQQFAHDGAVLLFDPCLVILAIGPGAGKLDAIAQAVLDHCFIDKFAAVVDIQRPESKRQADTDALECLYEQCAFAYDQRSALCSLLRYRLTRGYAHSCPDLPRHSARQDPFPCCLGRIIPVGKGSNRHATADLRHYSARLFVPCRLARCSQ
jgi:hypothetical protein